MSLKTKILFFTPSIGIGGIETIFSIYANALSSYYDIIYATCANNGTNVRLKNTIPLFCFQRRLRTSLVSLIRLINREKPKIIITGGDFPNIYCIVASRLSRAKPKVVISQHNYYNSDSYNIVLNKLLLKYLYNFSDAVLAVSSGIESFLLSEGVHSKKVYTIYNPINIDEILKLSVGNAPNCANKDYIAFIGRLDKVKNIYFLIDAFKTIEHILPVDLLIVGEGQESDNLRNYVERKALQYRVHFCGAQSNPYPIIANARAVVLPSFSEALPTVILEALVLGVTVVATPTKGALDILGNGRYGYVIDSFDNIEELGKAIADAYTKPLAKELLEKRASEYSVNRKIEELVDLINILERK